jgi:ankyrin repeat protein
VVQYLCEQGADKEARDNDGQTPLELAAERGHLPVVQYLCEQGVDKEVENANGGTLLHLAAADGDDDTQEGRLSVVQFLCP